MPVHLQESSTIRCQAIFDCLSVDSETDVLYRNVGNPLPTYVPQHPRRTKILCYFLNFMIFEAFEDSFKFVACCDSFFSF